MGQSMDPVNLPRIDIAERALYHSPHVIGAQSLMGIADFFAHWIGWGWALAFLIWLLGAVVILTSVQRYFLERTGSRRMTIVIFVVWSLAVTGLAAKFLGFGPPPVN
jgi:hypothetical protein